MVNVRVGAGLNRYRCPDVNEIDVEMVGICCQKSLK
jgi:hypothetical protein